MITRRFKRCGKDAEITFPAIGEWKERRVHHDIDGIGTYRDYESNAEARKAAGRAATELMAKGWVEQMQISGRPAEPQVAASVDETQLQVIGLAIASDLGPTPDWSKVWDRIGKEVKGAGPRRRVMQAVQAAHKDMIDEAARMARIKELAQQAEIKRQAAEEKERRVREMAVLLASQPERADGQRKIDWEA